MLLFLDNFKQVVEAAPITAPNRFDRPVRLIKPPRDTSQLQDRATPRWHFIFLVAMSDNGLVCCVRTQRQSSGGEMTKG